MAHPISAGLWVFASSVEKFSYGVVQSVKEQIKVAAGVKGLQGLELIAPTHVTLQNVKEIKTLLTDLGLSPVSVNPNLWTEDRWRRGAFTSSDPAIRREAIDTAKRAIDIGRELSTFRMCLWPGEDGFDYPFQSDHGLLWEWTGKPCAKFLSMAPILRSASSTSPASRARTCSWAMPPRPPWSVSCWA